MRFLGISVSRMNIEEAEMLDTSSDGPPLACVPGAIAADERAAHFELIRRLFGDAVEERRDEVHGYAFRFAGDELATIARFVANERKCCPFVSFAIEVSGDGPVWLRMTGPPGTREFLEAELPMR